MHACMSLVAVAIGFHGGSSVSEQHRKWSSYPAAQTHTYAHQKRRSWRTVQCDFFAFLCRCMSVQLQRFRVVSTSEHIIAHHRLGG